MNRKNSRVVPVVNRKTSRRLPQVKISRPRLSLLEIIIVVIVTIFLLLVVGQPLKNYQEQRAEIARLSSEIAQQEQQKEELLATLSRYQSEQYIKEQARTRLGVIEPGEIAFRVLDPEFENRRQTGNVANTGQETPKSWYGLLWDSVTLEDSLEDPVIPQPEIPAANPPAAQ